jgi:glycosyltransferase involved in cell wall biosynthesis
MKVSAVIPTFNRAEMLRGAINSILNQTLKDFEIIVVDNCSVDNTESVIKLYNDKRIRYFKHQNNGILAVNMNYGMKQARGEYIAFCDDDDFWIPEKLEKQLAEFEKDDRVALVCTNGIAFNETGEMGLTIKSHLHDSDFTLKSLMRINAIISSSILVKKSVIDEVGMMDEEPEIFGAEEYSLWIRIAKKYKIKYIDLPLMKYRTHAGAYRNKGMRDIIAKEHIYRKLLKEKIIDSAFYNKAIKRLNYERAILKFLNADKDINLNMICTTKTDIWKKCLLVGIYFLFRAKLLDTLRRVRLNAMQT